MNIIFEIEDVQKFKIVSENLLDQLYSSTKVSYDELDCSIINAAKEDLKKIILKSNFEMNKIFDLQQTRKWNQDKLNCFLSLLETKKSDLLYRALLYYNSSHGETIVDYDWFLKLVFGTSELKTLSYPLLQLILTTVNSDSEQIQRVFDINTDVLNKLINLLENMGEIQ